MALLNPTLRDPGPTAGSAAHWMIQSICQAERIAAFGPDPERATEDFERWSPLALTFGAGALVLAFFDPVPWGYEPFDGWAGGPFLDAFPDVLLIATTFAVDSFSGWLLSPWLATWADVAEQPALFGSAPRDDFEGWSPSSPLLWATATFDGGANADTFAGVWPVMTTL